MQGIPLWLLLYTYTIKPPAKLVVLIRPVQNREDNFAEKAKKIRNYA